jgi:glycosyltransferase involved in cell wall biosynthesis
LGEAQIWTVENGIPDDQLAGSFSRAEARRELGLGAETVLLWVGRAGDLETVRQKGLDVLFAALTRLREEGVAVELVLIGPALGDLRLAGIELPDWARAVGWRSRPTELMPAADALVVSSRFEGSSNVALEALMLGIPVVSTSSGDHAALVDAAGGALAAPGDARSLADAVARILADPPDRLHIKATAAPALSMDRVVAETLAVYRAVLAHRGSG